MRITGADYHRNGISGEGFYVATIEDDDDVPKLLVWFPEYVDNDESKGLEAWQTRIAVLGIDGVANGNIFMFPQDGRPETGGNAWRGDHYTEVARQAMEMVRARYEVK